MTTDHDRLFKELLSTFFVEFVDLFFPDLANLIASESIIFLDKELFTDVTAGEQLEADLVVKARLRGQESFFLIHTENQSESQSHFNYRMFRYFARLHEKYQLPIYPVAIFSFDAPKRAEPSVYRVEFPGFKVLEFNYRVVQLNRLDWRSYLNRPSPVAAALMSKMKMTKTERARVQLECLRMIATLRLDKARMQLISGFVNTYLRLSSEEEAQFRQELATIKPAEQEQVMRIVTSWMEQGLEQGRRQGILEIVLRLLQRRFGLLELPIREEIGKLSLEQLEQLGDALLNFTNLDDLSLFLNTQQTNG